jgi:3-hydroxybutyryl-CoA dehydratase
MSRDIPFDDIVIGQELGPTEIPVNEKIVRDYCDEFKDHNPIYLSGSPFGGPVVPPLFQATLHDLGLLGTKWDPHATVPSKTEHELINPARIGKRLSATGKIIDKYIKRGREYVVVQSVIVDEDSLEIRRCLDHVLLSLERTSRADTESVSVEGQWTPNHPKGEGGIEIPSVVKVAYQRALHENTFLSDSSHNEEYARSIGYPGRLVSGYVLCAYLSEMLVNFFGPGWLKGGKFSAMFISPGVQEGNVLTCRGIVADEVGEESRKRASLDIWIERMPRLKVVVGKASGVLSEAPAHP